MPNPKTGTVTFDLKQAISDIQAGKVEFRVDKVGIVHAAVGKANFTETDLIENVHALVATLNRMKPSSSKGQYIRGVTLSTTMGVGIKVADITNKNE